MESLDDGLLNNAETFLSDMIRFWESRRLRYNFFVGLTGVIILITFRFPINLYNTVGCILWGLAMNAAYTIPIVAESWNFHYLNNYIPFEKFRKTLFVLGTILSCAVSFGYGSVYATFLTAI
ncbi:MAG: hypothetical protein GC181_14065 [Bacteroidetes bacterium]|nr:hypothetical protein [Bacteroidota bacterium]